MAGGCIQSQTSPAPRLPDLSESDIALDVVPGHFSTRHPLPATEVHPDKNVHGLVPWTSLYHNAHVVVHFARRQV